MSFDKLRAWAFSKMQDKLARDKSTDIPPVGPEVDIALAVGHAGGNFRVDHVRIIGVQVTIGGDRYALDLGALLQRLAPADYADLLAPLDEKPIANKESGDA